MKMGVAVLLLGCLVSDARAGAKDSEEVSLWELAQQGSKHRRNGMFREAAEADEYYVSQAMEAEWFSGEVAQALATAARLRMALGDSDRAAQDVERFEEILRKATAKSEFRFPVNDAPRPDPIEVLGAELKLELGAHYAERKPLDWQAGYWTQVLRTKTLAHSVAHRIRAEVKLAQVRWQQSCPIPLQDGMCVRWRPYREPATGGPRCEPWTHLEQPQVWPRNPALLSAALQGIRRVLAAYPVALVLAQRRGGEPQAHLGDTAVIEAVESALLIQADERQERFLSFVIAPESLLRNGQLAIKAYHRWYDAWTDKMEQARSHYVELLAFSDGIGGQIAAARLLQSTVWTRASIWWLPNFQAPNQPPPKGMDPKKWQQMWADADCDAKDSEYSASRSLDWHWECVERAQRLGSGNPWLTQCEKTAATLAKQKWPLPSEIYSNTVDAPIRMDRADTQTQMNSKS